VSQFHEPLDFTQSIVTLRFQHSVYSSSGLADSNIVDNGASLLLDHVQRLSPGVLLCTAITILAMLLEAIEVDLAGHPYVEALVLAILIGVAIRTVWKPDSQWLSGIASALSSSSNAPS
jgi:hypothetical protein